MPVEPRHSEISHNFMALGIRSVYDVLLHELCSISIESIRNENWYIVKPRVPWGGTKKYPIIRSRDPEKGLDPGSTSDESLLIEDEEAVLDSFILVDIIPTIDGEHSSDSTIFMSANCIHCRLSVPVQAIPLLGCGDHEYVLGSLMLYIVSNRYSPLTCSDPSPQDVSLF